MLSSVGGGGGEPTGSSGFTRGNLVSAFAGDDSAENGGDSAENEFDVFSRDPHTRAIRWTPCRELPRHTPSQTWWKGEEKGERSRRTAAVKREEIDLDRHS